jgi:hypothetical protein
MVYWELYVVAVALHRQLIIGVLHSPERSVKV